MLVHELIAILKELPLDSEVVIPVKSSQDTIGPTPSIGIKDVYSGFDWDSGTVQLWTDNEVVRFTPEQLKALKVMQQEARNLRRDAWYKCRGMSTEDASKELERAEQNIHPIFRVTRN